MNHIAIGSKLSVYNRTSSMDATPTRIILAPLGKPSIIRFSLSEEVVVAGASASSPNSSDPQPKNRFAAARSSSFRRGSSGAMIRTPGTIVRNFISSRNAFSYSLLAAVTMVKYLLAFSSLSLPLDELLSSEEELRPPPESSIDSALRNAINAFDRRWDALEMALTRICKSVNSTAIMMKDEAASTLRTGSNSVIGVNPYDDDADDDEGGTASNMSAVVASVASLSMASSRTCLSSRIPLKAVMMFVGAEWRRRCSGLGAEKAAEAVMVRCRCRNDCDEL